MEHMDSTEHTSVALDVGGLPPRSMRWLARKLGRFTMGPSHHHYSVLKTDETCSGHEVYVRVLVSDPVVRVPAMV